MREIKWRGKRTDNGQWVYGCLTKYSKSISYITVDIAKKEIYKVHTSSLGQYTGLKDKNKAEIYERDICKDGNTVVEVIWADNHQWGCRVIKGSSLTIGLVFPLWQWDIHGGNGMVMFERIGDVWENHGIA